MPDRPLPPSSSPPASIEERRRARLAARMASLQPPPPPPPVPNPDDPFDPAGFDAGTPGVDGLPGPVIPADLPSIPTPGAASVTAFEDLPFSAPDPRQELPEPSRRKKPIVEPSPKARKGRTLFSAAEVLADPSKGRGILDLDLPEEHPARPVAGRALTASRTPNAPRKAPPAPPLPDDGSPSLTPPDWVPASVTHAHVTPDAVWKLAKLNCTQEEAAGWFRLPTTTFRRLLREDPAVQEAWDSGQHTGKVSFRRLQLAAAEGGNAAMMIFLGKNLLGQKDNAALQVNTTEGSADKQALVERLIKAGEKMAARGRGEGV